MPSKIASVLLACLLSALVLGCDVIGGDDDDGASPTPAGNASGVRVLDAITSNAINEQQQGTDLVSRVFPAATRQVYAVLTLEGVTPGMEIQGRWFQLSVADAPPDGAEVSAAGVTLTEDNVTEGRARVALNLNGGSNDLPQGDWVVRVYANGSFIRTMAFVITQFAFVEPPTPAAGPEQQGGQQPPPPTTEPTPIPVAQEYTVQSGDSLSSIAEQFRAPEESVEAFVGRLVQLNALEPGSTLFVGQVLQIPAAP